jgi:hypothetical protein
MQEELSKNKPRQTKLNKKPALTLIIPLLIVASGILLFSHKQSSRVSVGSVPERIQALVNFPIYYPNSQKLPAGYSLDKTSFTSPAKDVVLYTISYDQNKKMVFSLQTKPSDNDLKTFNNQRIPVHIEFQTKLGKAELGIIGSQAIVSLPTNDNVWIIVTGPQNLTQAQVAPIIESLIRQ